MTPSTTRVSAGVFTCGSLCMLCSVRRLRCLTVRGSSIQPEVADWVGRVCVVNGRSYSGLPNVRPGFWESHALDYQLGQLPEHPLESWELFPSSNFVLLPRSPPLRCWAMHASCFVLKEKILLLTRLDDGLETLWAPPGTFSICCTY
eukprot:6191968-Pleurochrysis_carterae.AAC.1